MNRNFSADSKYSADQGPLTYISAGHVCKQTLVILNYMGV